LTQELEVQKQRYEDSLKTIKRQAKELKEREKSALIEPPTPQARPTAPPDDATKPPRLHHRLRMSSASCPGGARFTLQSGCEGADDLVDINRPLRLT